MDANETRTSIFAHLEFSSGGYLKSVFLQCHSDEDQEVLERALGRLLKSDHIGWFRRLLRRTK